MNFKYLTAIACALLMYSGSGLLHAQADANAVGKAIFAANCAACHGSDGNGGERAPSISTRREVLSLSDAQLINAVQHGVSGTAMPPFGYLGDEKVRAVVLYVRSLQGLGQTVKAPGDPHAGEQLFFGKAKCSTCHVINGRGGFIAGDLTGYGTGRSIESVRDAILDPNRSVDRRTQVVTVVTEGGQLYKGLVRNEDNFFLSLQTEDGVFHSFSRNSIARIEYSGRSLMPDDYDKKLGSKEVDDLVSFLLKRESSGKENAGKHGADDDDD